MLIKIYMEAEYVIKITMASNAKTIAVHVRRIADLVPALGTLAYSV